MSISYFILKLYGGINLQTCVNLMSNTMSTESLPDNSQYTCIQYPINKIKQCTTICLEIAM